MGLIKIIKNRGVIFEFEFYVNQLRMLIHQFNYDDKYN